MNDKKRMWKAYFRFIGSVYKRHRLFFMAKVVIALLGSAASIVTAVLPKYMADAILIDRSNYGFIFYVFLSGFIQLVLYTVVNFIQLYVEKASIIVKAGCSEEMLDNLYRMAYRNYEIPESRDCMDRAYYFATQTGVASFNTFITMVGSFVTFVSYIYILAKYNAITLLLLTVSITVTYILQKRKAEYEYSLRRSLTTDERRVGYYKSVLLDKQYSKDIRYSGLFPLLKSRFTEESKKYSDKVFKKKTRIFAYDTSMTAIHLAMSFAVTASFGSKLLDGSITYGDYTITINVSMALTNLVFQIIGNLTSLYSAALDGENYSDFLGIAEAGDKTLDEKKPDIVFENVSFRYGTEDRDALRDFSYTFKWGRRYAIIGENGSGKSTLLKLMLGMYAPTSGRITVGGADIGELDPASLYSVYTVVFQDFTMLDGLSVAENITAGDSETDDGKLRETLNSVGLGARLAQSDGDDPLKREYSRSFDLDGIEMSGGEKQKAAIARALLKSAPVTVLDEPTSAVDKQSQEALFGKILSESKQTVIYVTHNHALTDFADEVLTLDGGELTSVQTNRD